MSFTAKLKAIVCFVLFTNAIWAQTAIGTWKVFMPFNSSLMVCDAGDKVYSAGEKSIFSYEKATGVIQLYDKSNALSDVDIRTINYDVGTACLVVAYNNANIDLIFNGTEVYNIRDILNENTSTSIGINSLSFNNGNCYVSTDLGISVINLERKEISNTYIIGATGSAVKVYSTAVSGNYIYAATYDGVKYAPVNSTNLQDFNAWTLFTDADSIPAKYATLVESVNNRIYAVIRGGLNTALVDTVADTLYTYNGSKWEKVYYNTKENFTSLKTVNGTLYFTIWNDNNTNTGKQGTIDAAGIFSIQNTQGHARPLAWFNSNSVNWEADFWNGLFKNANGNIENIVPEGPFRATAYDLEVNDGTLYVAPGGVDDSWGNVNSIAGFFIKRGMDWENHNMYSDGVLNEMLDFVSVAHVPAVNKTYFASYFMGIAVYDHGNKSVSVWNKDNVPFLEATQGDLGRTRISAVKTDRNNNLWIANVYGLRPLKVVRPDGSWKDYTLPSSVIMKEMMFDANGQLWAPLRSTSQGLMVWSNGGTIDDESDDDVRILNTGAGNGNLPDPNVYSIAEDKDGNVWVGTNQGIATFYCAGSILNNNYSCDADRITVERDGYLGYLFGSESVRVIEVDAANRKWIGTTNGAWLISADGKTELLKFNTENSPLPSNLVTDIEIDEQTGEVYIGTAAGIVSYQGDATGQCKDCDGATVYPNPVKPSYTGPIAIKGLVEDAYVKITDVSGTLIYQGKANGTQMVWDGNGYKGERAKSGVYLVFSSTELGKEKQVAKIVVAN